MLDRYKKTLAPRLLILIGVAVNAMLVTDQLVTAMAPLLHILVGITALVGLVWFLATFRTAQT